MQDASHKYGIFDFCDNCYPEPSDDRFIDPMGTCEHSNRPRDFFELLRSDFPDTGPPKTSLVHKILDQVHQTAPDLATYLTNVRPRNIYAIFFTMPWQRMLTAIPRKCPEPSVVLSIRMLDFRMQEYIKLRATRCASMVRIAVNFLETAHGVSVSYGTYINRHFPGVRQWLPCYAPVEYFSSVNFEAYLAVPVNPRVGNIQSLLAYRSEPEKLNGPKVPLSKDACRLLESQCLEESRMSVSDVSLERRITDLENIKKILGQALLEFCDEDATIFLEDIQLLWQRYSDELTARREFGSTFVYASYLFAQSSSYETTRGARFGTIPFADKFAVAYYRFLEQGYVLSVSSAVIVMTPDFYCNVQCCRETLQTQYAEKPEDFKTMRPMPDKLELIKYSVSGLLTPTRLWQCCMAPISESFADLNIAQFANLSKTQFGDLLITQMLMVPQHQQCGFEM